ncbi:MAG: SMP-30/gluconolactonase/LRE family protein [Candidatus Cloacimonadaceae bacterium]
MKKKTMGIILGLVIIIIIGIIVRNCGNTLRPLNKPESVAFDPDNNRFLISNVGSGSIAAMDSLGNYSIFLNRLFKAPRGIIVRQGKLYVTDPQSILVVDIANEEIIQSYDIDGAIGLNDIAFGDNNRLYITDSLANCVFVLDMNSGRQDRVVSELFDSPKGIVYDRPRWQMFVVNNAKHSPILSLNTREHSVDIFMDTMYSQLDGIAIDDKGRIYFGSWEDDMIVQIPQEQNRFITDLKGYKGAADFYYHLPTNELIVPMFNKNRIERIELEP